MTRFLPFIAIAFLLTACEPCKHYNRLSVVSYVGKSERKPYGTIRPYHSESEIGRPYEAAGFMGCEATAGDEAAVLKAMLYRAADMGADGLLLNAPGVASEKLDSDQRLDIRWSWMTLIGSGNQRLYRAQAIRFK